MRIISRYIGAPDPRLFDSGTYSSSVIADTGITVHLRSGQYKENTIIEFSDDKGRHIFLKNDEEAVVVRGGEYRFRNAPQFMSFVPTETTRR